MTITIKDTTWTSNVPLASILSVMTKAEMLKICDKLELYVSPNLKKDEEKQQWHMLMPDEVRESLKGDYQTYLDLAEAGQKLPSKKQLRLMTVLARLHGEDI